MKSIITGRSLRRTLGAVAAVGTMAGVAMGLSAGAAAADTPGEFKLCAYGNYYAVIQIPQQNGVEFVAKPGQCVALPIAAGTTWGNVYGNWNTNNSSFYISTVGLNPKTGLTVAAEGITTDPCLIHFDGTPNGTPIVPCTAGIASGTLGG